MSLLEDIVFTTDLCYCIILCKMASAALNLFSRQNAVHSISPLVPHDHLNLRAEIHLDLLPIPLAAVEIDFQCHQDWIEFTSIPMGFDTILSLKVGNMLGLLPIALAFDEIDIQFHRKLD